MGEKNLQYELPKSFLIHILSFLIHILYDENKTWQGKVSCPSWKKTKSFCSFLELTQIINEEVNKSKPLKN